MKHIIAQLSVVYIYDPHLPVNHLLPWKWAKKGEWGYFHKSLATCYTNLGTLHPWGKRIRQVLQGQNNRWKCGQLITHPINELTTIWKPLIRTPTLNIPSSTFYFQRYCMNSIFSCKTECSAAGPLNNGSPPNSTMCKGRVREGKLEWD